MRAAPDGGIHVPSTRRRMMRYHHNLRKWKFVVRTLIEDLMPDATSEERAEEVVRRFMHASMTLRQKDLDRRNRSWQPMLMRKIGARYDIEVDV
jgi:hypothetical protein